MKTIVFKDGSKKVITGEEGKYWLCGEERIRRLSRQIAEISDIPEILPADEPEAEAEKPAQKPKKKSERKKKTEASDDGERGE